VFFLFLSTCIRDLASTGDQSNIILIVTGVEVIIGNSPRPSGTVIKIWCLKHNGVTTLTFCGHGTSSVTWPLDSRWSTSYGWSIVTMRLSSTVMEIWPFEVLPGRLFQEQRSVVGRSSVGRSDLNITLISYTPLHYIRNIAREEKNIRTSFQCNF